MKSSLWSNLVVGFNVHSQTGNQCWHIFHWIMNYWIFKKIMNHNWSHLTCNASAQPGPRWHIYTGPRTQLSLHWAWCDLISSFIDGPGLAHVSTSPQRTLCWKSQRNYNPRQRALSLGHRGKRKHWGGSAVSNKVSEDAAEPWKCGKWKKG